MDRSLVRARIGARHGDGADQDDDDDAAVLIISFATRKIRVLTAYALRALLNLPAEPCEPALCKNNTSAAQGRGVSTGSATPRGRSWPTSCGRRFRAALYHYQLAEASKGVIEQQIP